MTTSLADFGQTTNLRWLAADGPDLLPYATLTTAQKSGHDLLNLVTAVYEWQGAPLIFLLEADTLQGQEQLRQLRRLLAMRGDAPYLGVTAPGRLDVYHLALDRNSLEQSQVEVAATEGLRDTLARLGNTRPQAATGQDHWISNVLLRLLSASISELIRAKDVSHEDAISLVGRALFTRFLADRGLLPDEMSDPLVTAGLFDGPESASRTSSWLNETFNGDLLPLSPGIFHVLSNVSYKALGDVLRRAPGGQMLLGWEENWAHLDFAHIPVGVLSQAYELYLRQHAPERQRDEGSYYTPRSIANMMVHASFKALERQGRAHTARVLDPAAGAGVFLLTAFRELVAARWRADGRRPDTAVLRSILYEQVVGFDINESALRFAALGLYLMSIELDPEPLPVKKLKFENLDRKVLFGVWPESTEPGSHLGSLGPRVGKEHVGRYDLVIGNPPWSKGTGLKEWKLVRAEVARIASSRHISIQTPPLPNKGLDLPFVWRAMEWAKPGGQVAFALHARLLFQQGDGMPAARQAIFEALNVTSVINGVELRNTEVWPEVTTPFCLLFASNELPFASAGFRLISPRLETALNDAGSMRIDSTNAEVVPLQQLQATPDILKILFRGTRADLGLIERLRADGHPTLQDFWRNAVGVGARGGMLGSGNGYQSLRKSSRTRKKGDGYPGVDASYLHGKREITRAAFRTISVDPQTLPLFSRKRIHDPRSADLFTGPLVVVRESPSPETERIEVTVSQDDVVFSQSFYGYSTAAFPPADRLGLAHYLALVLGSNWPSGLPWSPAGNWGSNGTPSKRRRWTVCRCLISAI